MSEKKSCQNAFSVLLMSQTKKKANATTGTAKTFIECPCCHRHIHHANINAHLDKCVIGDESDSSLRQESVQKPQKTDDITPKLLQSVNEKHQNEESTPDGKQSETYPKRKNAFLAMNENAKKMYKKTALKRQRIHLENEEGSLKWYDSDKVPMDVNINNCKWSSSVLIKGHGDNPDIELTVSSAIASRVEWKPLVRIHSKFSVSVLKSILQKSIRRRRPMPSVRVAMELADKSFGDFIRRMPIVCLEDGFLHPDIPLFVWTMIASSKDYIPSHGLVKKLMTIVFEICSVPWRDELSINDDVDVPTFGLHDVQCMHFDNNIDEYWSLIFKSLILRRQYGGMACDIDMLNRYIWTWKQRLGNHLDREIVKKCFPSFGESSLSWNSVLTVLYSAALRSNSMSLVHPIIDQGLDALGFSDIHSSGIDFHVSQIINELMDPAFIKITDELVRREMSKTERLDMYKSWMWEYSSSINHRRPLISSSPVPAIHDDQTRIKDLWNNVALPILNRFTTTYIKARLAK